MAIVFFGGFAVCAGLVAFLITRGSGWRALAAKYPERSAYTGEMHQCRTFEMAALEPDESIGTRFAGGLIRVGATRDALLIATPAIVRFLFPTIRLPWSAIASAKPFEAPGWVKPVSEPG